jgi:hypothetical protein
MQESIFKRGQVSDAMYVVCKGLVRCTSSSSVSLFAQGEWAIKVFGLQVLRIY